MDQFKEGSFKIRIDQKSFLWIAVDVQMQPTGACELGPESRRVETDRKAAWGSLEYEKIIARSNNSELGASQKYDVSNETHLALETLVSGWSP